MDAVIIIESCQVMFHHLQRLAMQTVRQETIDIPTGAHAHVAQDTSGAQEKNERSGNSCLTSVNMCVTYSLKVCQQAEPQCG